MSKRKGWTERFGEAVGTRQGNTTWAIRTHAEVAAIMGISKQRVAQLERRAFRKIRAELRRGES